VASRKLVVEIIGDSSSLDKTLGHSTSVFGGTVAQWLKGAVVFRAFNDVVDKTEQFMKGAIEGAEGLKKAQASLASAVSHTGGNMKVLRPELEATAKGAAEFGINQEQATQALARATLITGSAAKAQKVYQEALVLSKATGKDFNSVLIAAGKAADGQTAALRRYGVMVDTGSTLQHQFNQVMATYQGQAEANTNASDKLRANFDNLQTTIGTALLPVFEKLVDAANTAVMFLQAHWPEISATISGGIQAVKPYFDMFKAWVGDAVSYIQAHWPQISHVIDIVMGDIKTIVSGAITVVEAFWQRFGGTITEIVDRDFHAAAQIIRDAFIVIQNIIQAAGDLIHGRWSKLWDDLKSIISHALDAVVTLEKTIMKDVYDAALAIGKAILDGIKDGFESLWHDFTGWASDKAHALVNLFKAPLRIHSPSQTMADEVGRPMAEGIIVGFEDGISNFHNVISDNLSSQIAAAGPGLSAKADALWHAIMDPILHPTVPPGYNPTTGLSDVAVAQALGNLPQGTFSFTGQPLPPTSTHVTGAGFGGSFADGGVVPGRPGEPKLILAHGGETVVPPGRGTAGMVFQSGAIQINGFVGNPAELTRKIVDSINQLAAGSGQVFRQGIAG